MTSASAPPYSKDMFCSTGRVAGSPARGGTARAGAKVVATPLATARPSAQPRKAAASKRHRAVASAEPEEPLSNRRTTHSSAVQLARAPGAHELQGPRVPSPRGRRFATRHCRRILRIDAAKLEYCGNNYLGFVTVWLSLYHTAPLGAPEALESPKFMKHTRLHTLPNRCAVCKCASQGRARNH